MTKMWMYYWMTNDYDNNTIPLKQVNENCMCAGEWLTLESWTGGGGLQSLETERGECAWLTCSLNLNRNRQDPCHHIPSKPQAFLGDIVTLTNQCGTERYSCPVPLRLSHTRTHVRAHTHTLKCLIWLIYSWEVAPWSIVGRLEDRLMMRSQRKACWRSL